MYLQLAFLGHERGSRLVCSRRVGDGGRGVCYSRGGESRRTERRGEGVVVSVSLLLVSSGHTHLPLTRRCPAIGVPQLRHRGFFLVGGGVPDIAVVVVCGTDNDESVIDVERCSVLFSRLRKERREFQHLQPRRFYIQILEFIGPQSQRNKGRRLMWPCVQGPMA